MSREAMEWALETRVGDPTRGLVLVALGKHAGRDGTGAWASAETLAEYAECSTRTVQRHCSVLIDGGLIREGDQSVVPDYIPRRRRPIVYDLAMSLDVASEWAAGEQTGRRAAAAATGAAAGRKGAPRRAEVRSSTPSWGDTGDTPQQHETGVIGDTPYLWGDTGDTPQNGLSHARGVSSGVTGGVSPVTPKQEKKPRTKKQDLPPTGAADAAATNAGDLVGRWIDSCRQRPPARLIGQMSREIRQLLEEGFAGDDVWAGIEQWQTKDLSPAVLPSIVNSIVNGKSGSAGRSMNGRRDPVETVTSGIDLARKLDAEERAAAERELLIHGGIQ